MSIRQIVYYLLGLCVDLDELIRIRVQYKDIDGKIVKSETFENFNFIGNEIIITWEPTITTQQIY